jgi:hypothetical protein
MRVGWCVGSCMQCLKSASPPARKLLNTYLLVGVVQYMLLLDVQHALREMGSWSGRDRLDTPC